MLLQDLLQSGDQDGSRFKRIGAPSSFAGEFDQPTFEPEQAGVQSHAMMEQPFCFDSAFPTEAARSKNIESNVVGQADFLLMPELNAGKMLYGNSNCGGGGERVRPVHGCRSC